MWGLPDKFDYTPFVGRELESVSFAVNAVHFSFGSGCSVTTDVSYSYQFGGDVVVTLERVPPARSRVMQLAGRTIVGVNQEGKGTLVLLLNDGARLVFHEEQLPYESYRFVCGGKEVFV